MIRLNDFLYSLFSLFFNNLKQTTMMQDVQASIARDRFYIEIMLLFHL